jgi:hypothetical protein
MSAPQKRQSPRGAGFEENNRLGGRPHSITDTCTDITHPLRLAMLAADDLRQHLHDYAQATDRPAFEAVQAADLLDAAADLLAKAVMP